MRQSYKAELDEEKLRRKAEEEDFMRKRRQLDSEHME